MEEIETLKSNNREGEKGAVLVMVLLISLLLLIASAGLLLEATMNTANVTDSTADQQAYNAAESGIQTAINVLRGNTTPSPLINPSPSPSPEDNKISFIKALNSGTSNKPNEGGVPRLSRWINYDLPVGAATGDRASVGGTTSSYSFSITISDPKNTGSLISYNTSGRFYEPDAGYTDQKTWVSGSNTTQIKYTSVTVNDLPVSSGSANTDIGKFTLTGGAAPVTLSGTPASYPRFEIVFRMTKPYTTTKIIFGYIEPGNSPSSPPKILFDSQAFTISGSILTINSGTNVYYPNQTPQRIGYEVPLVSGENTITASETPAEPTRLLITSTGYGPRGAVKQLEAIIQKNFFDGLTAPATLTLVGPPSTTSPTTNFVFNPGSSNVTQYSGDDVVSNQFLPPIGTTDAGNLSIVSDSVDGKPPHPFNGTVIGTPSNIKQELPDWLNSPKQMDTEIQRLYGVANSSGAYFPVGQNPTSIGDNATAKGITFVDHDMTLTGSGGGILICTGTLTLNGNFNFNGLIIVTGAGGITRSGGGTGTLQGNVVVAPYRNNKIILTPGNTSVSPAIAPVYENKNLITTSSTFLSPNYDLSGGGNSTIIYNSSSVANGLTAVSNFVLGVAEK